eukprot:6412790-Amphidinium_carterae.1
MQQPDNTASMKRPAAASMVRRELVLWHSTTEHPLADHVAYHREQSAPHRVGQRSVFQSKKTLQDRETTIVVTCCVDLLVPQEIQSSHRCGRFSGIFCNRGELEQTCMRCAAQRFKCQQKPKQGRCTVKHAN